MTFTYANAGHNPPGVFRNGKAEFLCGEPDVAAGPVHGVEYEEHTIRITEDFKLLLYTDGVTEAQDKSGGFFGENRLLELAGDVFRAGMTARKTINAVRESVEKFAGDMPQADDITMLCLLLGEGGSKATGSKDG
jgi:sigma-B regulation protein RsbU (phosphoserine phosphatase)